MPDESETLNATENAETEEQSNEEANSETDKGTDPKEENRIGYLTRKLENLEKEIKAKEVTEKPKKETNEDETDFKIFHAEELRLCKDEFKSYRERGYRLEDSLRLAKLDKGIKETSNADQAAHSSDAGTVNRKTEPEIQVDDDLIQMAGSREKAIEIKKKYKHLV